MPSMTVHILNVGMGDTAIIEFPSTNIAMVDVHRTEDTSLTDPIDYYLSYYSVPGWYKPTPRTAFRFVSTHPHEDHLLGLSAVHSQIGFTNFWHCASTYKPERKGPEWEQYKPDWDLYTKLKAGSVEGVRVISPKRGQLNQFWRDDGVAILSPDADLCTNSNPNNASYVLRVTYGGISILLTGDVLEPAWNDIVATHTQGQLQAQILVAAHHGRKAGYSKAAVDAVNPEIVIVSQGDGVDTSDDATADYRKHTAQVWTTRDKGDIRLWWDETGSFGSDFG